MFYEFTQNNSGGTFVVDDKVCHRLFVEADNEDEAYSIAKSLGCYWDGVAKGIDCPCCGDRWYSPDKVDIEKIIKNGFEVCVYISGDRTEAIDRYNEKYGKYPVFKQPEIIESSCGSFLKYSGRIGFRNIEEYAQFLADEYGWTVPDIRIYYKSGKVKEIF